MRSTIHLAVLLACALLCADAAADWVWSPERGWHNPRSETRGTADQLYAQGLRLYESDKYLEAAAVFDDLASGFPGSRYAKRAQFYSGEAFFEAGRLFESYERYESYLQDYPESGEIEVIVKKEYEIGLAFLNGARKPTFGINFLSLPSPGTGIKILESVVEHSPYSDLADDAVWGIAEYHYREAQYTEAADQYRRLAREYPDSEWATKSKFQAAICSERMSTGTEYSADNLVRAREQLEEFGAQHSEVPGGLSVVGQIAAIDENLAQKLWQEASFYDRNGKPGSAAYMYTRLQEEFPQSSYAKQAETWLAEHPEAVPVAATASDGEDVLVAPSAGSGVRVGPDTPAASTAVRSTPSSPAVATPAAPPPATVPAPAAAPAPGAPSSAPVQVPAATPATPAGGGGFVPRSHSSPGSSR